MSSYVVSDDIELYFKRFLVENNLYMFVDTEMRTVKNIEVMTFKQKNFQSFFNCQLNHEKHYLDEKHHHNKPCFMLETTESSCMDKIEQIEEACAYDLASKVKK